VWRGQLCAVFKRHALLTGSRGCSRPGTESGLQTAITSRFTDLKFFATVFFSLQGYNYRADSLKMEKHLPVQVKYIKY
jgi:hypothetical protein